MDRKLVVIMMLLMAITFIAGCVQQEDTTIKSQAEASDRITNVSQNIEDIGQTLSDIDKKLG